MSTSKTLLTAVLLTGLSLPTFADDDCDVPVARWQTRDAVYQIATKKGWEIQRLKIDDGCYKIRAKDVEGKEFKAILNPETLEVIKQKRRHERRRNP